MFQLSSHLLINTKYLHLIFGLTQDIWTGAEGQAGTHKTETIVFRYG